MLIPAEVIARIWGIPPGPVLHVGAHRAEERPQYEKLGWGPFYWVEAQPTLAEHLRVTLNPETDLVLNFAAWDISGVSLEFKISSNSESSSLFDFGSHADDYPKITVVDRITVQTKRLDEVLPSNFKPQFVAMDIQGAELQALKGLGLLIQNIDWIYLEVNKTQVYKGIGDISEVDQLLSSEGLNRIATFWTRFGWGDALYARTKPSAKLKARWFFWKVNQKLVNFLNHMKHYVKIKATGILSS